MYDEQEATPVIVAKGKYYLESFVLSMTHGITFSVAFALFLAVLAIKSLDDRLLRKRDNRRKPWLDQENGGIDQPRLAEEEATLDVITRDPAVSPPDIEGKGEPDQEGDPNKLEELSTLNAHREQEEDVTIVPHTGDKANVGGLLNAPRGRRRRH